uniref:interleukin-1 beta isoform X1 n=2 Tax=Oncorhynchus gorbuscha TaxID=8017 RepID=UPI001EAF3B49|nr:interleukin-1 beta isoform X1 [Oncorhynchus gorbuscha]
MECTDDQLSSIIMDNLLECVMERVLEPEGAVDKQAEGTFKRLDSPQQCTLCDSYQKSLVHNTETMVLRAVALRGGIDHQRARFNLSMYNINMKNSHTIQAQPVALRIASSDFNLSCSKQTDSTAPILQLERSSDDQLRTISAQGDTARFLFFMTTNGRVAQVPRLVHQHLTGATPARSDVSERGPQKDHQLLCQQLNTQHTPSPKSVYTKYSQRERDQTDGYCRGVELIDPSTTTLFGCPRRVLLWGQLNNPFRF